MRLRPLMVVGLVGVVALAVTCAGRSGIEVVVQARGDVPKDLTELWFQVSQDGRVLGDDRRKLDGGHLPETLVIESAGATKGSALVRVLGLRDGLARAEGVGEGTLAPLAGASYPPLTITLVPACCDTTGSCERCTGSQVCSNAVCRDASCTGCVGAAICQPGDSVTACGRGGVACQRCGTACDGGQCVGGSCGPSSCGGGCCDGVACLGLSSQDPVRCGAGGQACAACGAGQTCVAGNCEGATCNSSTCSGGCCDGATCVPFATQDVASCGTAGTACRACGGGETCTGGVCCAAGRARCNGVCVDWNDDPNNCGACGRVCPNGKPCAAGLCVCSEPADNVDGHCCPDAGSFLWSSARDGFGGLPAQPFCYYGPRPAQSITAALADCRAHFGLPCVGAGRVDCMSAGTLSFCRQVMFPAQYCGVVWADAVSNVGYRVAITDGGADAGFQAEVGNSCTAGDCQACPACAAPSCPPAYFCVLDPLGPRAKVCRYDSDCPPAMSCARDGGVCFATGRRPCCTRADCDAGQCDARDAPQGAVTGLCR